MNETLEQQIKRLEFCRDCIDQSYKAGRDEYLSLIHISDECLLPTEDSDETWVWSSSENSQNNSWNVYFSNGYFGNGNKSYSSMVRAVAAFQPSPRDVYKRQCFPL